MSVDTCSLDVKLTGASLIHFGSGAAKLTSHRLIFESGTCVARRTVSPRQWERQKTVPLRHLVRSYNTSNESIPYISHLPWQARVSLLCTTGLMHLCR